MITFLFWNLNRKALLPLIVQAVREYEVDVLLLAENIIPLVDLLLALNKGLRRQYAVPLEYVPNYSNFPVSLLSRFPRRSIIPIADVPGLTIRHIVPPIGPNFLLAAAHLPSKRYRSPTDQAFLCTQIIRYIEQAEVKLGHTRTVVIGDLNMNPFEEGLVGAAGFHAMSTRQVTLKGSRMVDGQQRKFFYNPMWSFFGDNSPGPPGTYYYRGSGQSVYYWHLFDQILLRPSVLPYFEGGQVLILTSIGEVSLLRADGTPDSRSASDHLPVLLTLPCTGVD